jgi:hypothetical protein
LEQAKAKPPCELHWQGAGFDLKCGQIEKRMYPLLILPRQLFLPPRNVKRKTSTHTCPHFAKQLWTTGISSESPENDHIILRFEEFFCT